MKSSSTLALLLSGAAFLAAPASRAATITGWNFNNNPVAINTGPAPSTGAGTASSVGMNIGNTTGAVDGTTTDTSDVTNATPLSSDPGTGGVNTEWRLRGGDGTASPGAGTNSWTSLAPIGSQGGQFAASTVGFTNIVISFDWSPTAQGEGKLQVEYTLDGSNYFNVPIALFTSFGTGATATSATNTTSANTVMGGYLKAGSSTTYMNGITANLSSIAGAANDPNFAIRLVNASTGADNTNVAGAALNNTSGNWRFDEVTITGSVPEPGTNALVLLALSGVALVAYRRRKQAV